MSKFESIFPLKNKIGPLKLYIIQFNFNQNYSFLDYEVNFQRKFGKLLVEWHVPLVLSEYKKQVVFYHKKRVFYYKKNKKIKNNPKSCFFRFFGFLYFFYVQSNVLSCFVHSLWLITWKQLLTVHLTHYVTAGRWIEVLWNEPNVLYWLLSYSYCCIIKI